jgi:hypothetical protein
LDPSIRDMSSSIGINMNEINFGQQLLRSARKLIQRTKNCPDNNRGRCRTIAAKRSIVKALCVSLLPTPTKEPFDEGDLITYNRRDISMRYISKQLGSSVGTGHRTLSSSESSNSDKEMEDEEDDGGESSETEDK